MNDALANLGMLIQETHRDLNQKHQEIESEIQNTSGEKSDSLLSLKADIERYLSWTYGQYTIGKMGQESSWSWIEWAINSGFGDLFGPYKRAYVSRMKNGATAFVNFTI